MPDYKYLMIGGGMAADAAVKAIREIDNSGSIGIVSSETDPPYKRPPLSKSLWKGKEVDSIWLHTDQHDVDLMLGKTIIALDKDAKTVTDDQGQVISWEKLLIATGGTPKRIPVHSDRVIFYRTFADYQRLRSFTEDGLRFAVIGAGFIGTEIAAALSMNQKEVVMLFPEHAIGEFLYPWELASFLNSYYEAHNVEVWAGDTIAEVADSGSKVVIITTKGRELVVDGIVVGVGIRLNTQLAEAAGLEVSDGIVVDDLLQTSHADIYAAGDVANFYNPLMGRRMHVEHSDNAVTMGGYAGRAMAGKGEAYEYLPFFYSDLFDLGYEAVGEVNSKLEMVEDWHEQFEKGVIYYLREGSVCGVVLWNVWDKVDEAKQLMSEPGPFTERDLKGRIT